MRFIITIIIALVLSYNPKVHAIGMESSRFRLESPSIDFSEAEKPIASPEAIIDKEAENFLSAGSILKILTSDQGESRISIAVSDVILDFDSLLPNTPVTQKNTIRYVSQYGSYELTLAQKSPLKKLSGESIDNTDCDKSPSCTTQTARIWKSRASYGLGYTISGNDYPSDFVTNSYYRSLANASRNEKPAVIMKKNIVNGQRESIITYKINIPSTQPDGTYETTVRYTALAGY